MSGQILLTEQEAADRMRLCPRTLRKARQDGLLTYVLIGRAIRYTIDDLESYIDALRQQSRPCLPKPQPTRRNASRKSGEILTFTGRRAAR